MTDWISETTNHDGDCRSAPGLLNKFQHFTIQICSGKESRGPGESGPPMAILEEPVVGQPVFLGDLYDARQDLGGQEVE